MDKKLIAGAGIAAVAIFTVVFLGSQSNNTMLSLISDKRQYAVGEDIAIQVVLTNKEGADGVDAFVSYDPTLVTFESTDTTNSLFSMFLGDKDTGSVHSFSAISLPGESILGSGGCGRQPGETRRREPR